LDITGAAFVRMIDKSLAEMIDETLRRFRKSFDSARQKCLKSL
jgi:hypothetical protein